MGRSACCSKVGLRRGPWSAKEDSLLSSFIQQHGEGQWRSLPKKAGLLRCGKSCRLRWMNYLRPGIKRGNISEDEEDLIVRLHGLLGNRWSLIAGRLPGRTDNEIKNYWNTHLLKKLTTTNKKPTTTTATKKKKQKQKQKPKPPNKALPDVDVEKGNNAKLDGKEIKTSNKVYLPKPIRVLPRTHSYDSLVSGGSSTNENVAVALPSWPPLFELEDPGLLYHYSDSISGDVNVWEEVYAEYMRLL